MPTHRTTQVRRHVKKASIAGGAAATATVVAIGLAVPPGNALSLPDFPSIPGIPDIPGIPNSLPENLGNGELLKAAADIYAAFGGEAVVDGVRALADGDPWGVLNAFDQHEDGEDSQLVTALKAIQAGDAKAFLNATGGEVLVGAGEAIKDRDPKALLNATGGETLVSAAEAIKDRDAKAFIGSFEDGGLVLAYGEAIKNRDVVALIDAADRDADGDGADSGLSDLLAAFIVEDDEEGIDWVGAGAALGFGPYFELAALVGITPDTIKALFDQVKEFLGQIFGGGESEALLNPSNWLSGNRNLLATPSITSTTDSTSQLVTVAPEQPAAEVSSGDESSGNALLNERPLLNVLRGGLVPGDIAGGNGSLSTAGQNTRQGLGDVVRGISDTADRISNTADRLAGAATRVTNRISGGHGSDGGDAGGGAQ